MKLYIVIPDVHDKAPDRLSRKVYHPAYRCVEEVIKGYKPDGIINLGDTTDLESLCYFDRDKRRKMEGRRYKRDIDSLNMLLDRQMNLAKNAEKIYFIGNHEYRVDMYVDYHPEAEGTIDFLNDTKLKERGYEVVPFNEVRRVGKAILMHGFDSTMYHAAKMSRTYDKPIYYGHVHDVQTHSFVSPITQREIRVAESLGCLCDLNPSWLLGKPNRWVHAFGMLWVKDNGEYQMDRKIIIRGETIVNGKVFSGN